MEVTLAAFTLIGAICTGFFKLVNDQNKTHARLVTAMDKVASSNEKIAKETAKGNVESAERNGHLGELILKQGEQTEKIVDNATTSIINGTQHVDKQEVIHQHIQKEN